MSAPSTAAAGETITVGYTVRNSGRASAGPSTLACLLHGPSGLQSLGTAAVSALASGRSTAGSLSVTIPAETPGGTSTLQLVADIGRVVTESNESNNTATRGLTITNQEEPMPLPTLPQAVVDTTFPAPRAGATTHVCTTAGQFTTALTNAVLGDIIELTAGNTFTGNFVLPNKTPAAHSGNPDNSEWIVIRSSAHASLPAAGTRVGVSDAANMPKIQNSSGVPLDAAASAHHYRLVGLEVKPSSGSFLTYLVRFGVGTETTLAQLPDHIVVDRCYVHGDTTLGSLHGITLNGASIAVIDSYISDCMADGGDSQAVVGWAGTGPFKIVNNYLEATGENILFGGSDPLMVNLIPSDITIQRNHLNKPLRWNPLHGSYDGSTWDNKNLLEIKNARRLLFEGNLLEHCWVGDQIGWAIIVKSSNSDDYATWSTAEDIMIRHNIIRDCARGITYIPFNGIYPSIRPSRVAVMNNLFIDIGDSDLYFGPVPPNPARNVAGMALHLSEGYINDLTIEHNTSVTSPTVGEARDIYLSAEGHPNFIYRNNISAYHAYGLYGGSGLFGTNALNQTNWAVGWICTANVWVEGNAVAHGPSGSNLYPAGNTFLSAYSSVGFVDLAGGNYRLASGSAYKNAATDGTDIGVDMTALETAQASFSAELPEQRRVFIRVA